MIPGMLAAFISSLSAFIATNLDDLLILTLFFSQAPQVLPRRHIVWGQYLGFAGLVLASLPGFFGGLVISRPWIGLLGLVPIALGVGQWLQRNDEDATEVQTAILEANPSQAQSGDRAWWHWQHWFAPQMCTVAAVTIANGADNIGIYVPLFASSDLGRLIITLLIFFVMIGVWCLLAQQLAQQPTITKFFTRYSNTFVPIVFIGLGIFIIFENGTLALFTPS